MHSLAASLLSLLLLTMVPMLAQSQHHYEPTWASLDTRQTPEWFLDEKFYIFIHWASCP